MLPFDALSRDAADDEFAEGLLDAIITELSRVPGLRVISRQSVRHLKGSDRSLVDIAAELHVGAIVAGTVLRDGDRVKVTAGLIELDPDERQVWGEIYEDAAKPAKPKDYGAGAMWGLMQADGHMAAVGAIYASRARTR